MERGFGIADDNRSEWKIYAMEILLKKFMLPRDTAKLLFCVSVHRAVHSAGSRRHASAAT